MVKAGSSSGTGKGGKVGSGSSTSMTESLPVVLSCGGDNINKMDWPKNADWIVQQRPVGGVSTRRGRGQPESNACYLTQVGIW